MNLQLLEPQIPTALTDIASIVDRLALEALLEEVSLDYKPGLVCPSSAGSHKDMNYILFLKSIQSLTGYFYDQFLNGFYNKDFEHIRQRGLLAEQHMLMATHGINTHKGAIFNLGFACAAIGKCIAENKVIDTSEICKLLQLNWSHKLLHHFKRHQSNHGQQMREKYGITGAIEEVASGFSTVNKISFPLFEQTYLRTKDTKRSAIQTLFGLIANVQDTNIVWRGGLASLMIVKEMANNFLYEGGVFQSDWQTKVIEICHYFEAHNLSPGGSADLLGVTLFFYKIEHEFSNSI